jgi:cephalosporin hydroxylase
VRTIVEESEARAILEVGTSYGYSTVWLAEAARATGGIVTSLELQQRKIDYARAAYDRLGVLHVQAHRSQRTTRSCGNRPNQNDGKTIYRLTMKDVPVYDHWVSGTVVWQVHAQQLVKSTRCSSVR